MGRNTWIQRGMKRIGCFPLLFFFLFWHSAASAEDYYWTYGSDGIHYPSAIVACQTKPSFDHLGDVMNRNTWEIREDAKSCLSASGGSLGTAYRVGNSCVSGLQYNAETGACDAPPGGQACLGSGTASTGFGFITNSAGECVDYYQADTSSQCKNLANTTQFTSFLVSFNSDGDPIQPPPMSVGGCEAIPGDVSQCTMEPVRCNSGNGLSLCTQSVVSRCKIAVSMTGNLAGDGSIFPAIPAGPNDDGVCDPVDGCPPLEPAPIQNDVQPCTYVLDGEGRKVCSSSKWNSTPGQNSCGSVNGEWVCVGKAPTSNGINIGTIISTAQNSDGTTTTTKDDTVTQTKCIGANSCTTQTTNNRTVTINNSDGTVKSQTGTCTGAACSSDGKGDTDGDGLSDCVGYSCTEEEGVGAQDWHEKSEDTYGSVMSAFSDRVKGAPVMTAGDQFFAFNPSGACPRWDVQVWVFDVVLDQHCSTDIPWDAIKAIILACAGFVAFRWAFL